MKIVSMLVIVMALSMPAAAQDFCPALTRLRADYPTPMTPAQLGAYLTQTVQQTDPARWALQRKDGEAHCPAVGTFIACDILVDARTGDAWDVLKDADGAATPDCHADPNWPHGTASDLFVFAPAVPIPGTISTTVGTPLTTSDLAAVRDRLAALETKVDGLTVQEQHHSQQLLEAVQTAASATAPSGVPTIPPLEVDASGGFSWGALAKWASAIAGTAAVTCVTTKCWQ